MMKSLEFDKTSLRATFDPSAVNIRMVAKQQSKCKKVFIPMDNESLALIYYKSEEDAEKGLQELRYIPGVISISYNIRKQLNPSITPQNGNAVTLPATPKPSYHDPEPFLMLPKCAKCFAWPVIRRCGVCGTCYCDVNCQKQDWPLHKEICMPNLFIDPALKEEASKITPEQKMQYYAKQKPPTANDSPDALMKQAKQKDPENLHQEHCRPYHQQGDHGETLPSVQSGEKQQNNIPAQQDSQNCKGKDGKGLQQEFERENCHQEKFQQKKEKKSQQKQPNQEPSQKQCRQEIQKKPKEKPSQQEPQQKGSQQEPKKEIQQKQLKQEPPQKPPQKQQKPQNNQPQPEPPKEQQQLLNKLPLRALVARAKEESKRRVLQQGSFPSVGSEVKIAHVAENTMFIFEAGSGSTGQPSQYLKFIERCFVGGEAAQKYLIHAPVPGDIVYSPFEEVYYRAEVRSVTDDKAIVFFTDFGNTETLEWKKFKEIEDPEIKYADRLIHEVQIEHLPTFTDFVRMQLQALEGEAFELSKVVDIPNSKTKMVELRHLREMLLKKPMASPDDQTQPAVVPPDPKSYVPVSIAELSEVCIPYGDGIELMIIDAGELYDASHRLAVIDIARNDAFAKVLAEVCKYGEADSNVYSPEESHHLCLVQCDGIWSRGVPLATGSQETSNPYCLLDLGIIKSIESTHVRRFPQALSRKLYVADCIVQNPETLCKLATEGVQNTELLTGKMIKVNVIPKKNKDDEIQQIRIISVN
ncbi:uncharacterized protein LOC125949278 [Anopheles darlingi]|uniref:uncharacterized protein LOC125949278 n=1 Tax=Anopheles darlingi TaxID=43151 RepID=UPI0021004992|nr:uncharacterized protein LOC125949278 [Anopheles darlingi]